MEWIPFDKENLPKSGSEVLFTNEYGIVYAGIWIDTRGEELSEEEALKEIYSGFSAYHWDNNRSCSVLAWMYYPEPYKEVSEE